MHIESAFGMYIIYLHFLPSLLSTLENLNKYT